MSTQGATRPLVRIKFRPLQATLAYVGLCLAGCASFSGDSVVGEINITAVERVEMDENLGCPEWSPDGRHCAFTNYPGKLSCCSARDFRKRFDIPYESRTVGVDDHSLNQWAPNGKYVYGIESNEKEEMALAVYDTSGRKLLQTPYVQSIDSSSVRWSPDSTKIAFNEDYSRWFHKPDVWVVDIGTKQARNLTPDGLGKDFDFIVAGPEPCDFGPEWSPDGKELLYVSGKKAIMKFSFERNQPTQLVSIEDTHPLLINKLRWSPSGDRVIFDDMKYNKVCIVGAKGERLGECCYGEEQPNGPCDIVWLDGGRFILLDFDLYERGPTYPTSKWLMLLRSDAGHVMSWQTTAEVGVSPKRRYLAYVQKDENDVCSLHVMDVQNQKTKKLAEGKAGYGEPMADNTLSFTERSRVYWTPERNTLLVRSGFYWYRTILVGVAE